MADPTLFADSVVDETIEHVLAVTREALDPLPPEGRVEVLASLGSMFLEIVDEHYAEQIDPYFGREWQNVRPDPAYL